MSELADTVVLSARGARAVVAIIASAGLAGGLAGSAVLLWGLAPERCRRGVEVLGARPLTCYLLGLLVAVPIAVLAAVLLREGPGRGGFLVAGVLLLALSAGLAVSARWLGERALPEASPPVHLLVGLVALCLPAFAIVGLAITATAATAGLGAWLRARAGGRGPG